MNIDLSILDGIFAAATALGEQMAMRFAEGDGLAMSKDLLMISIAVEIMTAFLILLMDSASAAMQRGMQALLPAAIIAGAIANWGTIVVPTPIRFSDELVTVASGGAAPAGLGAMVAEKFAPAVRSLAANALPSQQPTTDAPTATATTTGGNSTFLDSIAGWWDSAPVSGFFVQVADAMVNSGMMLVDVALLIACFAVCWMSILSADILIYLGLCLGPIMLSLSIIGKLRSLVANWIAFMMGLMFLKPVLAILLSFCLLILDQVNAIAQTTPSSQMPATAISIYIGMLLACMLMLILNAKTITSALFGGLSMQMSPPPSQINQLLQRTKKAASSKSDK